MVGGMPLCYWVYLPSGAGAKCLAADVDFTMMWGCKSIGAFTQEQAASEASAPCRAP